jgi:hypothetical protein
MLPATTKIKHLRKSAKINKIRNQKICILHFSLLPPSFATTTTAKATSSIPT